MSGSRRAAGGSGGTKRACCMVSEILEEAGIDRERARQIRRQLLEGVVLMCQWQLERMRDAGAREPTAPAAGRRARKIEVK